MDGYLLVLALIALPIFGNSAGGLLAEVVPVSQRTLSLALHAAAGIVLAVVGLELMPEALEADPPWVPIVAFTVGALFFLALDNGVDRLQAATSRRSTAAPDAAAAVDAEDVGNPLAVYAGTSLDLFSDGVMIGTGSLLDPALGLLLAIGQTPADLPEGFATVATLRSADVPRGKRLLFTAGMALPILLGATLGYFGLRGAPDLVTLSVLALTGGALLSVVIEEIVPQAHRGADSKLATVSLVGGFALFAAIGAYVG